MEAVSDETVVVEIMSTRGLSYPCPGADRSGGRRADLIGWAITGNEGESGKKKQEKETNGGEAK